MECRPGCGACCIAPSISSLGKPAEVSCIHLDSEYRCKIFGRPERPQVCSGLQPSSEMCGTDRDYALRWLAVLEVETAPAGET
ncbi:MAG: YkgJ family cysteine cluster protein [Betaproteobacteria bacterium]